MYTLPLREHYKNTFNISTKQADSLLFINKNSKLLNIIAVVLYIYIYYIYIYDCKTHKFEYKNNVFRLLITVFL